MQYSRITPPSTSQVGWLSLFFLFSALLPLILAAPGAGEGYLQARNSVPKPGVSLPTKTAIEVAPTTGLHPETTAIAVIPERARSSGGVNEVGKKKKKKKGKKGIKDKLKKGKTKTVTVVQTVPVTHTHTIYKVKRADGGFPTPDADHPMRKTDDKSDSEDDESNLVYDESDSEYDESDSEDYESDSEDDKGHRGDDKGHPGDDKGHPEDDKGHPEDDKGHRGDDKGDPMEIDPEDEDRRDTDPMDLDTEEFTTVSVLQVAVPTDRPVIVTTYQCSPGPTDAPTPKGGPELARKLIDMKEKAKVTCISTTSAVQADLASQTDAMEYIEGYFCDILLSRTDEGSGVTHVIREQNGANQKMSVTWVLSNQKPSKAECVQGMKMIWKECADLEAKGDDSYSGGKALFKNGVFYNLEAVTSSSVAKNSKGNGKGRS
ncbi:hypothetical protein TWF506_011008 [Arthrobotrys conoides]|uniref:Uncharacterized protein n=1 Tax=Arthrobotrys conoides TaxID=74498 RepID=A0AAN8RRS2_9PEZI